MEHKWDKYFDTTSECWIKLQALYAANEHFPKKVIKGRNLHHKFLRSWSKKDGVDIDNDDDNLVSLSEGDHFLAHFYIWKSANKGYRASAALAVRMMYRKSFKYITAEIAEDIAKVWEKKEYIPSEETKRKMSEACKNNLDALRKRMLGNKYTKDKHHKLSEETKRKLSEAHKGIKFSEETKHKISKNVSNEMKDPKQKEKHMKGLNDWHKKVKGTKWWNNGITNKMSKECPGDGWRLGIIHFKRGSGSNHKGKHWKIIDGKRVYY